jgi:hypothetical protein
MKRLIETEGEDPLFQRGTEVIRKTSPTPDSPDVRARVWRSLERAPGTAPRGFRTLVPKLAPLVLVLIAGTAGAVAARRWLVPAKHDGAASPTRPALPPARAEKAPPPPDVPVVADIPDETPNPKPPARTAPRKTASPPATSAASVARERTEVLDALVALRRHHDPVRAGTLLARYLSAHPHGALREEALALAMEAADARGDRPSARQLAHVYLDEFPAGRFLIFARSHTDGSESH